MTSTARRCKLPALALLAAGVACGVDPNGLEPPPDAAAGGAGGTPVCPAGIVEQASWPAKTSASSCLRPCGPDEIGVETCRQVERSECQKRSGCLCLQGPCVACDGCTFLMVPDCYVPTNAASAAPCAEGVSQGGACSPACGRMLCLERDGKTACLCNREGKYACADWDGTTWL
jgi:hypothetical protein